MAIDVKERTTEPEKQNFKNQINPIWCPGCGDYGVLNALTGALSDLGLVTSDVAVVTGIGCSSRLPGYMSCYGFNAIHGRPIPIATGLKAARPDITVIAAGGDGDGFSIGGGHLMHAVRRNIDITYIVMDNGIYGLTKGQVSPTTPLGYKTKTTSYGAYEKPVNPLEVMLAYGSSFVGQAFAGDLKGMKALFAEAISFPGFSFVDVISPCPTYRGGMGQFKELRQIVNQLTPENHDIHDWDKAHALTRDKSQLHLGVLYQEPRESYDETQRELQSRALERDFPPVEAIADSYK